MKKITLDFVLTELYEVETKKLRERVKKKITWFRSDFMFEFNLKEF